MTKPTLSPAQEQALIGAYEVDQVYYHGGNTATGRALYAKKVVGFEGELTELGHALRDELLEP